MEEGCMGEHVPAWDQDGGCMGEHVPAMESGWRVSAGMPSPSLGCWLSLNNCALGALDRKTKQNQNNDRSPNQ